MKHVVDSSFVASLFLPDELDPRCSRLLTRLEVEGATAPVMLQFEFTNIVLTAERRKRISRAQLKQLSDAFNDFPVTLQPALTADQRSELLRLAQTHKLTAYDAAYLEAALRLDLSLATLDQALVKAAAAEGISLSL